MNNFSFGSIEDTAQLYFDTARTSRGPGLPDLHPEEMDHKDLINQMVYLGIATELADRDGAYEVREYLHSRFDEIFVMLAEADDKFRARIKSAAFIPFRDGKKRNQGYYLKLAGLSAN